MSRAIFRLTRDLSRRTNGSVSLLFALLTVIFFSFIGAAIDYSRWNNAQGRTADALDAALLNAARALQTSQGTETAMAVAQKVFDENAASRLKLSDPHLNITIAPDGLALDGRATGKVRTPFMALMRLPALHVTATSRVGFGNGSSGGGGGGGGTSELEISMMLDVTGSMCDDGSGPCNSSSKMDALKLASSDLINIVLKGNNSNARIALVPFATRIRLGPDNDAAAEALMKKVTDLDPTWTGWYKDWQNCTVTSGSTSETSGTWNCTSFNPQHAVNWRLGPCVTDRTGLDADKDTAPGSDAWLNGQDGTRRVLSWDSSDTPIAVGNEKGLTNADPSDQWNYNDAGICWDMDPKNVLMPLTNDKPALLARVNDLVGYGATAGTLGTAWSWYTLSPNWNSVWTGTEQPGSYADTVASGSSPPKLRKIAVLMTDGVYNSERGWLDQDTEQMAIKAKAVCTAMKAQGIEIYTVGFDLDALPPADKTRATALLTDCATSGPGLKHFYQALDAEQLKQAFRDIAMQLSQIYIAR